MTRAALTIAFIGSVVGVSAQTPAPVFDVVSIRRDPSSRCCLNNEIERPGGGFSLAQGSIAALVARAYGVLATEIEGLPKWTETEAYDIIATGGLARATLDDRRTMKVALLAERFSFRGRVEMRDRPAFDLVKARGDGRLGPGLVPYEVDCHTVALAARDAATNGAPPPPESVGTECSVRVGRGGVVGAMPIWLLASALRSAAGREVVDKTGITGTFRVNLTFAQPATAGADAPTADTLPSIFTALQEQLGLRLEPSRAPMRVLVVERIERPTPN